MTTKKQAEKAIGSWEQRCEEILAQMGDNPAAGFDVTDKEGMRAAKDARADLRNIRVTVENERKELKAPLLEIGRAIDGAAKKATETIERLEKPIHDKIKREEDRIEREKAEAARKEAARLERIQQALTDVLTLPARLSNSEPQRIRAELSNLEKLQDDPVAFASRFEERGDEARQVISSTVVALRAILSSKEAAEKAAPDQPSEKPSEQPSEEARPAQKTAPWIEPPSPEDDRKAIREAISDLKAEAGIGAIQAENVINAIAGGRVRHLRLDATYEFDHGLAQDL